MHALAAASASAVVAAAPAAWPRQHDAAQLHALCVSCTAELRTPAPAAAEAAHPPRHPPFKDKYMRSGSVGVRLWEGASQGLQQLLLLLACVRPCVVSPWEGGLGFALTSSSWVPVWRHGTRALSSSPSNQGKSLPPCRQQQRLGWEGWVGEAGLGGRVCVVEQQLLLLLLACVRPCIVSPWEGGGWVSP